MRSVRMLIATATATAALAIAPAAHAVTTGDWDHEDHSYSKEHDKHGKHDAPRGGMHTGGGALAAVSNDEDWGSAKDPKHDPDTYRSKGEESWGGGHDKDPWKDDHGKDSWKGDEEDSWGGDHDKDSWRSDHGKPHGGMHTGGGALDKPGVTAGGLAALAVAGTGMYALRRRKASGNVA